MIWLPTLGQVLRFHSRLIERTGGSDGVRDAGLIESAILRASAGYGGCEVYSTVAQKAAAVCCGLVGNHGFVDGNKRIGIAVMLLILQKNGCKIAYTQAELIFLGLAVAQNAMSVEDVTAWIEKHMSEH